MSPSCSPENAERVIIAINTYLHQVFTYGSRWSVIESAVAADPDCVLANVLMADFAIAFRKPNSAMKFIERARTLRSEQSGRLTERESLYVSAYSSWLGGKKRVWIAFDRVVSLAPTDLFAIKKAQIVAFLAGNLHRMLTIVTADAVIDACQRLPYYNGILAFSLEENKQFVLAERAGRRGVEIAPDDVWSVHAVAHCLYGRGRLREGVAWMKRHESAWNDRMSFMYTHAWFHAALFYLDLDELEETKRVIDKHCWIASDTQVKLTDNPSAAPQMDKTCAEDQFGALNLLWKLDCRSVGAGAKQHSADLLKRNRTSKLANPELTDRYQDVVKHIQWPPISVVGLFALLLMRGLCRAGDDERAKELMRLCEEKIAGMSAGGSRRLKHQTVQIPWMKAVYIISTDNNLERAATKCYDLLHPMMPAYCDYLHQPNSDAPHYKQYEAEVHEDDTSDNQHYQTEYAVPTSAPHVRRDTLTVSVNSTAATSAAPLHEPTREQSPSARHVYPLPRHILQVIGGSGEQRGVLLDLWLEILINSAHFQQTLLLCEQLQSDRTKLDYLSRIEAVCRRELARTSSSLSASAVSTDIDDSGGTSLIS